MAESENTDSKQAAAPPSADNDGVLRTPNEKTDGPVNEAGDDGQVSTDASVAAYSSFSSGNKILIVLMTVFATLFSPFSSFIYLPAITPIAEAYHRSVADINLTVTLYQVMQAIAPVIFGDLSDQLGRRPVYMLTFAIYLGANVGLALQNNYVALLVLRAMQSTGSSATVAISSAIMADCTTSAERGGYITAVQASIMFAPALAPVIGGILTEYLGWRSTFWFLVIAASVFLLVYLPFVPESARKVVGDGSVRPPAFNMSITTARHLRRLQEADPEAADAHRLAQEQTLAKQRKPADGFRIPVPNVFAAVRIMFEKDVGPLMLFMSLNVMANYAMLVPLQDVIRRRYNFNDLQVGLCYIPFAMGSVVGALAIGRLLNWNFARVARSIGISPDRKRGNDMRHFPIERARLDLMWPCTLLAVAMMIAWGWVVAAPHVSLAGPLVVLFFSGVGLTGPVSILTTLLVDLYPMNPGRVSSTFNLTRATLSAIGTAVVQYIIDAWGYGYTYLFLGLLVLAFSPTIYIVRRWGPQWREERHLRFERAAAKEAE
ncbi:hypothetical protein SEPCBS57363_003613 [Sporothrix epigloea]|uniref:Major facilitator superfamily (MFS) profile domain-containing protein n=1 Tax=Sporothrix epigloea TaxID=1892477 RepID=A0ABP0DNN3_9PEZI